VEELAVAHVVAELELLVREQIAVGVQDALREPGGAGRVVELRGVVGGRVDGLVLRGGVVHRRLEVVAHHEHALHEPVGDAVAVGHVRDRQPGAGVAQAMLDPLVAVQHRHRQQDRPVLVGAEEDRGGLR
jgi:hypothetical protein